MSTIIIPSDKIVCGHPWSTWTASAAQHYGHPPTVDEVAKFIADHEHNAARFERIASVPVDMDQIEDLNRLELRFQRLLRDKYPHLAGEYAAHMKRLST